MNFSKLLKTVTNMWNKMSMIQRAFLVVALMTVLCSVCADCVLCSRWPLRLPLSEGYQDAAEEDAAAAAAPAAPAAPSDAASPTVVRHEGDKEVVIKLFYAPWCPHCKNMMPEWDKLPKKLNGTGVQVDKVDCDANPEAAKENDVDGFPTIILFKDGKAIPFNGERTAEDIVKFISAN